MILNGAEKILSGKSDIKNNKKIKYIGKYQDYIIDKDLIYNDLFILKEFSQIKLKHTEGIEINFDNGGKKIQIFLNTANDKIVFYDSKISDYEITFKTNPNQQKKYKKVNNLTGCLTFHKVIFDRID